jgi:hypothetical protein
MWRYVEDVRTFVANPSNVEGLNNKVRVIQRRAYGLRDEEYLRLKILTPCCLLSSLTELDGNDPHDSPKSPKKERG